MRQHVIEFIEGELRRLHNEGTYLAENAPIKLFLKYLKEREAVLPDDAEEAIYRIMQVYAEVIL